MVFDTHHYTCYNLLHPDHNLKEATYYIPQILETWKRRGIKPKFHVSEQGSGRIGHHSDYIKEIPEYLLEIPKKYDTHIDIMIEAKMKEKTIMDLYKKYPKIVKKRKLNLMLLNNINSYNIFYLTSTFKKSVFRYNISNKKYTTIQNSTIFIISRNRTPKL